MDPIDSATLRIPQSWNKFVYALNNPLRFLDKTGLAVSIRDDEAFQLILATLPEDVAKGIELEGFRLISKSINSIKSDDPNFLALKHIVNSSVLIEVGTAGGFSDANGNTLEFVYQSVDQIREEMSAVLDQKTLDTLELTPISHLGQFIPADESLRRTTEVVVSRGEGKSATAPYSDRVVTMAHELFGHGLPFSQNRPFEHDKGVVDKSIIDIELRTRNRF